MMVVEHNALLIRWQMACTCQYGHDLRAVRKYRGADRASARSEGARRRCRCRGGSPNV